MRGTDRGTRGETALLRDQRFLLFLSARTVSVAGYAITAVALPLLVLRLTGSAFATALVAAVEVLPYFVFGLVAGAVADRLDRKRLMLGCQFVAALSLASVPAASLAGFLTPVHVFVVAALVATCFVWFDAASFGALPALVGRDRLAGANSLVFTSATVVEVSFPAVAGVLIAAVGPALALGADAVSYLLAAVLLWRIPGSLQGVPRSPDRSDGDDTPVAALSGMRRTATDIREGLEFLWGHDVVRSLSLLGFGNSVTGGAVTGLLVVYGVQTLGLSTSDARIGALYSAAAAGGLVASMLLPRLSRTIPIGWITIGALTANPVFLVALALAPNLAIALPVYLLWAATWMLAIINGITARQLVTPDHLQSRVNTTARMIAWGGTPFGAILGGLIAETTSVRTAYLVMPVAVATSAALAWRSPLRRRDLMSTETARPG